MRISRIFIDAPLNVGTTIDLNSDRNHYIIHVLRLRRGDRVIVFNGCGGEFEASIIHSNQSKSSIHINRFIDCDRESALQIKLLQGLSRNEHMELCLQKAVELGVAEIQPIITERCPVKVKSRHENRLIRWLKIIISASEQCGRTRIAKFNEPIRFADYFHSQFSLHGIVLDPNSNINLSEFSASTDQISILIGPEGGLSEREIHVAASKGLQRIRMGARTLRTETAAITAIAAIQFLWGDLR